MNTLLLTCLAFFTCTTVYSADMSALDQEKVKAFTPVFTALHAGNTDSFQEAFTTAQKKGLVTPEILTALQGVAANRLQQVTQVDTDKIMLPVKGSSHSQEAELQQIRDFLQQQKASQ